MTRRWEPQIRYKFRHNTASIVTDLIDYSIIQSFAKDLNLWCKCNYNLFTKLPRPGDSEGTFWFSSQTATSPHVYTHGGDQVASFPPAYHTRWRFHTAPFIADRQAGKL